MPKVTNLISNSGQGAHFENIQQINTEQYIVQNYYQSEWGKFPQIINHTHLPSEVLFSFRNTEIGFYGRDKEIQNLEIWLNQGYVSVWAVTGQGGSGKSRLALHLANLVEKEQKAKAVWLDETLLEELLNCNVYSYPQTVLFICDYAAQYEEQLKKLICRMSGCRIKAKFLLLERQYTWYSQFINGQGGKITTAYREDPLNLTISDLSNEDYSKIIFDFHNSIKNSADRRNYRKDPINQNDCDLIIQKARVLSTEKQSIRCLFLLLVADAYLRNGDVSKLDATALLQNYIKHSKDIIINLHGNEMATRGNRVLAFATACDGIKWDDEYPVINEDLNTIIKHFWDDPEQIDRFFSGLSEIERKDIVSALKPDLIGEFFFLNEWERHVRAQYKDKWLSVLLQQKYSRIFFARCMTNWKKESTQLCNKLLESASSNAYNRRLCAEVFFESIREANSVEERDSFFSILEDLADSSSLYVMALYAHAKSYLTMETQRIKESNKAEYINSLEYRYVAKEEQLI